MTKPDYRALCAELVDDLEMSDWPSKLKEVFRADIARARALLDQQPVSPPYKLPEPEGPTDEQLMELMPQQMRDDLAAAARALAGFDRANIKAAGAMRIILNRHAVDHARAALAKWGHQ